VRGEQVAVARRGTAGLGDGGLSEPGKVVADRGDAVTLDFITIPTAILRLPELNLRQKLLLALVLSFNDKGLRISNQAIGEILDIKAERVSKLLADIERKDYVRMSNAQSRWRTIYLSEKAKVHFGEKAKVANSTLAFETGYFGEKAKHKLKKLKDTTGRAAQKPLCDESFQRFWNAYPKKQKKPKAQKAWRKLNPDPELAERIIQNVQRRSQTHDWQKENNKYVPLPENYLNDQRWADELPEPKRGDPDWLPTEEDVDAALKECGE